MEVYMTLGDVVKECMKEKGISVKELAELTEIAPTTLYSFFSRGGTGLSITSFLKIAQVLEVSADELYARSDPYAVHKTFFITRENGEYLKENLRRLLADREISVSKICEDLNIEVRLFCRWLSGEEYPRSGDIGVISEYLGVSKEDLMGIKAKKSKVPIDYNAEFFKETSLEKTINNAFLSKNESKIIESYRRSDNITKEAINRLLAYDDKEIRKKKDSEQ
jgi:transcriptional regulator with XRE-family HTH domain